jgi:hypothetical protein
MYGPAERAVTDNWAGVGSSSSVLRGEGESSEAMNMVGRDVDWVCDVQLPGVHRRCSLSTAPYECGEISCIHPPLARRRERIVLSSSTSGSKYSREAERAGR